MLGRTIDLNDPTTAELAQTDAEFRAELDAYISKLASKERSTKPAIRGLIGLPRPNPRPVRNVDETEEPDEVPDAVRQQVEAHIRSVNETIEGEILEPKKKRRRS